MDETQAHDHSQHIRHEQEHLRWSADHMRALAVLRRVEAHLYDHEAEIVSHRAEISSHEETLVHGSQHNAALKGGVHEAAALAHAKAGGSHDKLLAAIIGLNDFL